MEDLASLAKKLPYELAKEYADKFLSKIWEKIGLITKKTSDQLVKLISPDKKSFLKFSRIVFNKYSKFIKEIKNIKDNNIRIKLINWKEIEAKYSPLLKAKNKLKKFLFKYFN